MKLASYKFTQSHLDRSVCETESGPCYENSDLSCILGDALYYAEEHAAGGLDMFDGGSMGRSAIRVAEKVRNMLSNREETTR